MSLRDPRVERFEATLKKVFDRIDARLEKQYGGRYALHPARADHGATGNPEQDGLFNIGAAYSAGFGSRTGEGYVVDVRMATLSEVPASVRSRIEQEVARLLDAELPRAFPGRDLRVTHEGHTYKIHGDLGLGRT